MYLFLQLSFQMWTNQMQESLNYKKNCDVAFRSKDYTTAVHFYTQIISAYQQGVDVVTKTLRSSNTGLKDHRFAFFVGRDRLF